MEIENLNSNQIEYVFFHLKQHIIIPDNIVIKFCTDIESGINDINNSIIFVLSGEKDISFDSILYLNQKIPVLFPIKDCSELFSIDENSNLLFHHDFLKAAFYVLCGLQEIDNNNQLDHFSRFRYDDSLQRKFNCAHIPLVNYYFDIIISGFEHFGKIHNIPIKRLRLFSSFGFFLSHDVDRTEYYHFRETAYKIKQLIGLAPLYYSWIKTLVQVLKGIFYMFFLSKNDPWWNFGFLTKIESKLNIKSAYYFLHKRDKKRDSRYKLYDLKIEKLIKKLIDEGFEVGVHGSFDSYNNAEYLKEEYHLFKAITNIYPLGIRQHFLRFKMPNTLKNQLDAGFVYDTSLAFPEHEGFRNGYCYPFKPYDFNKDKMIDIWELPLTLMEATVLDYQKQSYEAIAVKSEKIISEVQKFGGFFSLLWHNCRFDEYKYPGITIFYQSLLKKIMEKGAESLNGEQIVQKLNKLHSSQKNI
ncbi:MAG: polysaccharide deacetylase family protein [Marinilabiliaceae bacterium]|nr:polysaccharide deacetylase family protein [Marinilabiliaceae bacterium]